MKRVYYGILAVILIVLIGFGGCALTGSEQQQSGPHRGDQDLSGNLTNADVTINDWKVVIGLVACFCVSGVGFLVIGRLLVKHHAAIGKVTGG